MTYVYQIYEHAFDVPLQAAYSTLDAALDAMNANLEECWDTGVSWWQRANLSADVVYQDSDGHFHQVLNLRARR